VSIFFRSPSDPPSSPLAGARWPDPSAGMADSDSDDNVETLQYKVIVLGDGAVGKTSLIMRFCEDSFQQSYKQTIGLDFFIKRIVLPGNVHVTLQLWDIGGQQLGGRMLANYIYGSHGVILVYDVTNMESFKNLEDWYDLVKTTFKDKERMPYVAMIGNKMDLNHLRVVKSEKHSLFAVENGMSGFFVSAKTGDKVNPMFVKVAADLAGMQLTKAELEVSDNVVQAQIVNHPNSDPSEAVSAVSQITPKKESGGCLVS
jgi:Ras-related protein Rab-28